MKNKRVLTLDLSGMVAGSKYRGEFEERIKKVLEEVRNDGEVLLFIDELHTIIGAGGAEGAIDASNILKPSLARGEIQLIGATTLDEYRKYIEKDAALERRFQPVNVNEPSEEETLEILKGLRGRYEAHHKVHITDDALKAAVKLSARYINDRFLPDKAIDLIDEASSKVRLAAYIAPDEIKELEEKIRALDSEKEEAIKNEAYERAGEIKRQQENMRTRRQNMIDQWEKEKQEKELSVTEGEIADVVSQWTKIPVRKLEEEESERLKNLESILHQRVVGRGGNGCFQGHPQRPRGTERSQPPHRFLPVFGSHGRGENRAFQSSGRGHVWNGKFPDPGGHVRVYGKAQRIQDDRFAARICGL